MKTKAIVATMLVAAAASADARFAWPYPPKAVSPDEIGHWAVINGNAWPASAPCSNGLGSHPTVSRTTPQALGENFEFPKMSPFERLRKVHEEKTDS